jgi:hypothetical protein
MTHPRKQLWTTEEEEFLRAHYENTSTKVIAEQLGRTVGKVYQGAPEF